MKKLEKKGFTVIEVVLVLAIAGLIFTMVFIALPALQRNQRDAQRRDDMATFVDALKKFQTNNRGALPEFDNTTRHENRHTKIYNGKLYNFSAETGSMDDVAADDTHWSGLYKNYLKDSFIDPSGFSYNLLVMPCGDSYSIGQECKWSVSMSNETNGMRFNNHYILVNVEATCDGSHAVKSNNPRKVAVMYAMEGPGVYCTST